MVISISLFVISSGVNCMAEKGKTTESKPKQIGRPVRVVSLSFNTDKTLKQIAKIVDNEGAKGADIIAMPETMLTQSDQTLETIEGETTATLSALAKKHHTYIVFGMDRMDGNRRVNSSVLLDRQGNVAAVYDKIYPFWAEFDLKPKVAPGTTAVVHQADFGRLGLAICFDANFPNVWQSLADQDAELVIWISAYSSGTSLQAHAINHHFYIVSSTYSRDCQVYDITGERILDEKSDDVNISRITLDLDRGIYHNNFNTDKRDKLLKEQPDDIFQEKILPREEWFVLTAKRPGVSARGLAKEYGMEELRDYLDRSRREIDQIRGCKFPKK